jgi:hypothetical protein
VHELAPTPAPRSLHAGLYPWPAPATARAAGRRPHHRRRLRHRFGPAAARASGAPTPLAFPTARSITAPTPPLPDSTAAPTALSRRPHRPRLSHRAEPPPGATARSHGCDCDRADCDRDRADCDRDRADCDRADCDRDRADCDRADCAEAGAIFSNLVDAFLERGRCDAADRMKDDVRWRRACAGCAFA